jgi:hypothetical protein
VGERDLKDKVWERNGVKAESAPDLHSQFETILDFVWRAEANWAFDDRLDVAVGA